jgi:DNA-binding CsgD family transcriptional regulator
MELISNHERMAILELSRALVLCEDEQDFRACFDQVRGVLPVTEAIAFLARVGEEGEILHSGTVDFDFPPRFVEGYRASGMVQRDPLIAEVLGGSPPLYWRTMAETGRMPAGLRALMVESGLEHGYLHGVAAGGPDRPGSCFSLHTPTIASPDARCETVLSYLAPFLHLGLERALTGWRPPGHAQPEVTLTRHQVEVLRWVRAGKNNWEIAQILKVSENTVKYHMRNILRRLGVTNRACAVARALERKLIGE